MAGNAYVTGHTDSFDFPTVNAVQPGYGGGPGDAFVTELDVAGSTLVYSTFLGGTSTDWGRGVAVDAFGHAVIVGGTFSSDFPVVNALQPSFRGGTDAFVTKLSPTGATPVYSTYLGGSADDVGNGVAVDRVGAAYVAGGTNSSNFPLVQPLGPSFGHGVGGDAFVAKLDPNGSSLRYSTYLGGDGLDYAAEIAVDASGSAYLTGSTFAPSAFPTVQPFQPANGGGIDAFVAKIADPSCPTDVTSQMQLFRSRFFGAFFGGSFRFQWVFIRNHTSTPIAGPLFYVMDDLQNAVFIGSPLKTHCFSPEGDPLAIVGVGRDNVLRPNEVAFTLLFFKAKQDPIAYTPRVLSGIPSQ